MSLSTSSSSSSSAPPSLAASAEEGEGGGGTNSVKSMCVQCTSTHTGFPSPPRQCEEMHCVGTCSASTSKNIHTKSLAVKKVSAPLPSTFFSLSVWAQLSPGPPSHRYQFGQKGEGEVTRLTHVLLYFGVSVSLAYFLCGCFKGPL